MLGVFGAATVVVALEEVAALDSLVDLAALFDLVWLVAIVEGTGLVEGTVVVEDATLIGRIGRVARIALHIHTSAGPPDNDHVESLVHPAHKPAHERRVATALVNAALDS